MCRLKKALYGLKQALRAWYSRIDNFFLKDGFRRCLYEHALYIKEDDNGNFLIIYLYVDLIFTENSNMMIEEFKERAWKNNLKWLIWVYFITFFVLKLNKVIIRLQFFKRSMQKICWKSSKWRMFILPILLWNWV